MYVGGGGVYGCGAVPFHRTNLSATEASAAKFACTRARLADTMILETVARCFLLLLDVCGFKSS